VALFNKKRVYDYLKDEMSRQPRKRNKYRMDPLVSMIIINMMKIDY
jgi:hypothetical protein